LIIDGAFGSNPEGSAAKSIGKIESGREERSALDEQQLVNLKIGDEEFGINIMNVQEIIRLNHITNVPGAPDYVKGVVNLRGNVLPVIDLRRRFELDDRDLTDSDRIVVVTYQGKATGLIVDSVSEVLQIPGRDIEPPPDVVSGVRSRFIDGIGKLNSGKRFIIILNIAEILGKSKQEEPDDLFGEDESFIEEKPSVREEPMEELTDESMEEAPAEEMFDMLMEEPAEEEQPKPKAKNTKKKK
jgi:purine-binding chemotaxis protein CheW